MQHQFLFNENTNAFKETRQGIAFSVKIKADAKENSLKECIFVNDSVVLKITIKAQPEKGKANKELIAFLANMMEIKKESVFIKGGLTDKHKLIEVKNPCSDKAKNFLNKLINKV